jgi:glucose/arabinose dehydrogenase
VAFALAMIAYAAPSHAPRAQAATGAWTGAYYNSYNASGPTGSVVLTRTENGTVPSCGTGPVPSAAPTLDCFWDPGATGVLPGPGVNAAPFAARWTRTDTYAAGTYRFTGTTDDGMRIYVDGTAVVNRVVDAWFDQGPTTYYADKVLTAGSHTVTVDYYNATNGATAQVTIQNAATIPTAWTGQYFSNQNLTGSPALTRNDPAINFDWTLGSPDPSIPVDHFSVRWTQTLPFNDGVYSFTTTSDDGARVYIDGQLILNFWVDQAGVTNSVNKQMTAGQHTVVVEYYEDGGGASMVFNLAYRPDLGGFVTDVTASGLTLPTVFAFAPDGRIFIGQKDGNVKVVENGALLPTPYYTISNLNNYGDRGLIGLALDPQFASNGYVYLSYSWDSDPTNIGGPKTAQIIRVNAATPSGDVASAGSKLVLLGTTVGTPANPSCENFATTADCIPSDGLSHSVGNLKFGPDGKLYIATGDGASYSTVDPLALRSQDINRLSGKILRVDPATGLGLPDNPFYNGTPSATRSKVWAYGVRNDFRFNFKPGTPNTIVSGEVGWDTWEEINVVTPGVNLGWPCYEGNFQQPGYAAFAQCQSLYAAGGTTFGIYTWDHSAGTAAAVGGAFSGDSSSTPPNTYKASYQDTYWFADYAVNTISTLKLDASNNLVPGSVQLFTPAADGPVDLETGPDGDIYYMSIGAGELRHIRFVGDNRPPVPVTSSSAPLFGVAPVTVSFSSAGTSDPDTGQTAQLTYDWDFGDGSAHSALPNPSHQYTTTGNKTATLTVTDPYQLSATSTLVIQVGNTPPTATISTPADLSNYDIGDLISFTGSATDTQDGAEPPARMAWSVILVHCLNGDYTNCHVHYPYSTTGASGRFTADDHGDFTYYQIYLTVTDAGGLTDTKMVTLKPNTVDLTFTSNRVGAQITVDGGIQTAPFTHTVPRKSAHVVYVPSPQTLASGPTNFSTWSDAGAQQHTIVATASGTYTVNFVDPAPTPTNTATSTATQTSTSTPTNSPTPVPTATSTPTPTPTNTPVPTATSTSTPAQNLPPSVGVTGPSSPVVGAAPLSVSLNAQFGDPESDPVYYTITWGDGTIGKTGKVNAPYASVPATHTYAWTGTYTLRVSASDLKHPGVAQTFTVHVGTPVDADGDGIPDDYEAAHACLLPGTNDAAADPDVDGLTNIQEYQQGTNPCLADTDGDGYTDGQEAALAHGGNGTAYCGIMRADVQPVPAGDGTVSILDFTLMATKFAQAIPPAPARYDQNNDASISILDLSSAANFFAISVANCP